MVRQVLGIFLLAIFWVASAQEGCGECNRDACPPLDRSKCLAGVVRDGCNCCQVCSQLEGEACDMKDAPYKFGVCGDHLECKPRSDDPLAGYCSCKYHELLCGTDNKTYDNFCKLSQRNKELGGDSLKVKNIGKCLLRPMIVSGPPDIKNTTGGYMAMMCEAFGYPIPYMMWQYVDASGRVSNLPGDDFKISMNIRGGPERSQITGWLQIVDINKAHEGDYKCIARNSEGETEAFGRLKVVETIDIPEEGENET